MEPRKRILKKWKAATVGSIVPIFYASRALATPQLGGVFYISMENKDFTEPGGIASNPDQIFQNPAAYYENTLITPGNANAVDVSYASNYTNAGTNVHPSEANYIWSEAGTNYNAATNTTVTTDVDPSTASGNLFTNTPHLTGLLNSAGISWKNYQEDYQVSGQGPAVSASGFLPSGQTNAYNDSNRFNYSAKHNPMVFFSDTATQNVAPLRQLSTDLANNSVDRYNWITPDQYNDGHTAINGGFNYRGTTYLGDSAEIAQGDNFLSIIIPQIEKSQAFQNNGAIVIWYDETEGGDTTSQTMPEIVISPLAKGNAYDSTEPLNHSSDLKTMQEIFGLGPSYLNNMIPADEYSPAGGLGTVNSVAGSNDLSDLFQPDVIPTSLPAANLTWNNTNAAAPSDGKTWDISTNNNWTSGLGMTGYTDGSNVTFNDSNAGNYAVTLNITVSPGSVTVNNSFGNYTISGSGGIAGTGSLTKTGSGTLTLSTVNSYTGGTIINAGTLIAGINNALPNGNVQITGGTLQLAAGTGLAQMTSLSITGNGTLDLSNNHIIINYGSGSDPIASIGALIASGYAEGTWTGPGIISTTAQANSSSYGIGYADFADPGNPAGLSSSQIEIMYTLLGDANLDGKVNGSDFAILATNFNKAVSSWDQGDFNYDGKVNGADFTSLAANFNKGASESAISSADLAAVNAFASANGLSTNVPEPRCALLIEICLSAVLLKRRKNSIQ